MATASFTSELLHFLSELRAHNERPWFQAHKARYEQAVRDPCYEHEPAELTAWCAEVEAITGTGIGPWTLRQAE